MGLIPDYQMNDVSWCWVELCDEDWDCAHAAATVQDANPAKTKHLHDDSAKKTRFENLLLGNRAEIAAARAFGMKPALGGIGEVDFTTHSGLEIEVKSSDHNMQPMRVGIQGIPEHAKAIVYVWVRDRRWAMIVGWILPREYAKKRQRDPQKKFWYLPRKQLEPIGKLLFSESRREGGLIQPLKRCDACYAVISGDTPNCPVHDPA